MKYSEGTMGRVFVLRLEDGDILNDTIEAFAREQRVGRALAFYLGGAADGSKVVVGPNAARQDTIVPLVHVLAGSQEVLALGTLFPNEAGDPVLHMHAAAGREGGATVGCTRAGVQTWLVGEVVLLEILGTAAHRQKDPATGFELLQVTNIDLDDRLIEEAQRLTGIATKRAVVDEALRVLIASRRRRSLLDIEGSIAFAEGYDHKAKRPAARSTASSPNSRWMGYFFIPTRISTASRRSGH
jgi:predicted DNA-binding protein with PD1-like motif/Arc/MetJ family transcription regulator